MKCWTVYLVHIFIHALLCIALPTNNSIGILYNRYQLSPIEQ